MGCTVRCLKVLLIIINILFGLLGASLLSLGIYALTEGNESVTENLEEELDHLYKVPTGFQLQDVNPVPTEGATVDIESTIRESAIFIIIIGGLLFFTSIVGAIGVCYNNGCLVVSYGIFLVVLLLIQALVLGLLYFGALDDRIKDYLKEKIDEDYVGVDSYDGFSLSWNLVMTELECCGVDNYTDFNTTTVWKNQRDFSINGSITTLTLMTPLACCKFDDDVIPLAQDCAVNPSMNVSNFEEGCWDAIRDEVDDNRPKVLGVIGGVLGFQLILIAAAFVIVCDTDEEKELDF